MEREESLEIQREHMKKYIVGKTFCVTVAVKMTGKQQMGENF